MKIFSWNVNGIRSVHQKGFSQWFAACEADVICLQEVKAFPEQLSQEMINPCGYHSFFSCAQKPGYSGVATFSRKDPLEVHCGIGDPSIDSEGRVLTTRYPGFTVINTYFPNSQRDHARLDYKLYFCESILRYTRQLVDELQETVILCGDLNIAHQEIDLKNPKTNQDNAGFLPEERAWMTKFLSHGFTDSFRHLNPTAKDRYSWWSYRPGVRERNIGWRLDYHVVNSESSDLIKKAEIHSHVQGSDHCPVFLEI